MFYCFIFSLILIIATAVAGAGFQLSVEKGKQCNNPFTQFIYTINQLRICTIFLF